MEEETKISQEVRKRNKCNVEHSKGESIDNTIAQCVEKDTKECEACKEKKYVHSILLGECKGL